MFDPEFTESLIIRDFDDVLKNPFRYVHLFLLHTLLSKKNSENRHARPVTEGPKLRCNTPNSICRLCGKENETNEPLLECLAIGNDTINTST